MSNEWLKSATLDLENIKHIINEPHLSPVVAFHAHQAIEKSFKAIFEMKEITVPKKHDLVGLFEILKDNNLFININENLLEILNKLYIDSRYPGEFGLLPEGIPSLTQSEEFYNLSKLIFNEIKKIE